jgi:glyoxylase-like metal-dependent hydrolase (beta-lactamase superfamily II)
MRPVLVSSGAVRAPTARFQSAPMRKMRLILSAIAITAPIIITAQGGAKAAAQSAAAAGAADREAVLREVGIAHGMLRGLQYTDATTTAQFQATGTQYIVGQSFKPGGPWPAASLTKYNVWINYAVPGIRIDLERTNPNGPVQGGGGLPFAAPQRQILVVGGSRAWNETMMPGGTATPAIGQEKDRALQIWMLPQGVVKAARMAGDKTLIGMEGNRLTLTFPLPEPVSNYIEKVRLDERKLVEHVEVMVDNPVLGDTTLEADYAGYKDPDLSDIPFPFHIRQKLSGFPILDVTVKNARMYNPYVVVPTPDNVEKAYAANAADPQSTIDIQKAGTGVFFITGASHNSVAVEFKNYIALIESPLGDNRAVPVFETLHRQFPNKKIRYVINTHHHFDHSGGLRDAVAEGTTILTYRDNKPYYEQVLTHRHAINPDRLQKTAPTRKASVEAVIDRRVLTDGTQTLELYKIQGSNHADTMLIAYLPKDRLLVEADMWKPSAQPNAAPPAGAAAAEPLNLWANIQRLKLDVAQIAPIHGRIVPFSDFRRAVGQSNTTN